MRSVLFVCTANICRSPVATGIFDVLAEDRGLDLRSGSAGVAALVGEPAAPRAVQAMDELGIDIGGHRARQVDGAMVEAADLVLTMTPGHREALRESFGGVRGKDTHHSRVRNRRRRSGHSRPVRTRHQRLQGLGP